MIDPRDRELLAHAEIVIGELETPTRDAERLAVAIRRRLADEIPAPDHPDVALVFEGAAAIMGSPTGRPMTDQKKGGRMTAPGEYNHEWKDIGGEYARCSVCGLLADTKDDEDYDKSECPKKLRKALDAEWVAHNAYIVDGETEARSVGWPEHEGQDPIDWMRCEILRLRRTP